MIDLGQLLLSGAGGLLLGTVLGWVYFQALWVTVSALPRRQHRGARLVLSLMARLALAFAVFVLVARWGGLPALLPTLAGFLAARTLVMRRARNLMRGSEGPP